MMLPEANQNSNEKRQGSVKHFELAMYYFVITTIKTLIFCVVWSSDIVLQNISLLTIPLLTLFDKSIC